MSPDPELAQADTLPSPLRINPTTGEPFVPVPGFPNIIITPNRPTDAVPIVPIMNDRRVYMNIVAPPYPYLPEHAEEWVRTRLQERDKLLAECRAVFSDAPSEGGADSTGDTRAKHTRKLVLLLRALLNRNNTTLPSMCYFKVQGSF